MTVQNHLSLAVCIIYGLLLSGCASSAEKPDESLLITETAATTQTTETNERLTVETDSPENETSKSVPEPSQPTQEKPQTLSLVPGEILENTRRIRLPNKIELTLPVGWTTMAIDDTHSNWFIAAPSYQREPREGIILSVAHSDMDNNLERGGWILSDFYHGLIAPIAMSYQVQEPRTTHIGHFGLHGRDVIEIEAIAKLSDRIDDEYYVYWRLFATDGAPLVIGAFDIVDRSPAIQKIFEELVIQYRAQNQTQDAQDSKPLNTP